MNRTLSLGSTRKPPHPPKKTLVFVIDALDECGSTRSRPNILRALTSTAAHAPLLKIIIISEPEGDMLQCFNRLTPSTQFRYDLTAGGAPEAVSDLHSPIR